MSVREVGLDVVDRLDVIGLLEEGRKIASAVDGSVRPECESLSILVLEQNESVDSPHLQALSDCDVLGSKRFRVAIQFLPLIST